MPSSQTANDRPSADPLVRLMVERENLIESGFYLGGSAETVRDQVVWKRIGRGNQLVTNESVVAVEMPHQALASAEDDNYNTETVTATATDANKSALLEPAALRRSYLSTTMTAGLLPAGIGEAQPRERRNYLSWVRPSTDISLPKTSLLCLKTRSP